MLNKIMRAIKGLMWIGLTYLDIICYTRLRFSFLLDLKKRTRPEKIAAPATVIVSLKPEHAPSVLTTRQGTTTKKDPDPTRCWVYSHFHDYYNLAEIIRTLLSIKYHLGLARLTEQHCHLLYRHSKNFSAPSPMPDLLHHFGKHTLGDAMPGTYRLNRFLAIPQGRFWELWQDQNKLEELRRDILTTHALRPSRPINKATNVLLISRGPAYFNRKDNIVDRRFFNEEQIIAALGKHFPKLRVARLETMTIRDQLQLINDTHILVGMHGAGLAHALFLPRGGGLLELFPCDFRSHYTYFFYAMAVGRRLHYARCIQYLPWREKASFAFRVMKQRHRHQQHFRYFTLGDYSQISPKTIVKRALALARRIENRK